MAEELKPCPVCGASRGLYVLYDDHDMEWLVFCDNCKTSLQNECNDTYSDAVSTWNRRAERTCRYVRDHKGVEGNWFCKCSECGAEFDERVVGRHFVYCPSCGALVIGEETRNAD